MASKIVTISSDENLEKDIREFQKETGLSRAEFHRRSSVFYMVNKNVKINKGD